MKPSSLVLAGVLGLARILLRRRLHGTLLLIGGILVVWFVVRGTGAYQLPDFETLAKEVGPTLGGWTYLIVGAMAFLETAFFVGLVAPGEFTVILGGFIAAQGVVDVAVLAPIVFLCAAAGDTTSFFLGRKLGRGFLLRHGRDYGVTGERLNHVEQFFRAHGGKAILIGRFVGLVRALAPFIAGASGVPARRFLPIAYLAAAIWAGTFVFLGYAFWQSFETVVSIAKNGALGLGAFGALLAGVVVGLRWLRSPTNRARLERAWRTRSVRLLRDHQ
jgi:membrane protein DedA with SNARE-associated domain